MNYDKFPIAINCVNPQFYPDAFFLSFSTGATGYFHDISRYIHDLHDLHGIYMIFSMLFVFCICRAHNFAENQKKKKLGSSEPVEGALCKSV